MEKYLNNIAHIILNDDYTVSTNNVTTIICIEYKHINKCLPKDHPLNQKIKKKSPCK